MIFSRRNPPPGFYVYLYFRKNGIPYYAGKGNGTRAWDKHRTNNKGIQLPSDDRIVIVAYNLTELWALALERKLIRWYRRADTDYSGIDPDPPGVLRNQTDGGDGCTGYKHTDEFIQRIKKQQSGSNNSFYGKKHTDQRIKQWTESMRPYVTGKNNGNYCSTVYRWEHVETGKVESLTQHDFYTKYKLNNTGVNRLVKGRAKKMYGWRII